MMTSWQFHKFCNGQTYQQPRIRKNIRNFEPLLMKYQTNNLITPPARQFKPELFLKKLTFSSCRSGRWWWLFAVPCVAASSEHDPEQEKARGEVVHPFGNGELHGGRRASVRARRQCWRLAVGATAIVLWRFLVAFSVVVYWRLMLDLCLFYWFVKQKRVLWLWFKFIFDMVRFH